MTKYLITDEGAKSVMSKNNSNSTHKWFLQLDKNINKGPNLLRLRRPEYAAERKLHRRFQ